jgi:hypothetical protein
MLAIGSLYPFSIIFMEVNPDAAKCATPLDYGRVVVRMRDRYSGNRVASTNISFIVILLQAILNFIQLRFAEAVVPPDFFHGFPSPRVPDKLNDRIIPDRNGWGEMA